MTGVEKNNDDAWRNYFSSNLRDPAGKILKAEIRSEYTEQYKCVKRQYNKRDDDSWQNGGIEDSRKKQQTE